MRRQVNHLALSACAISMIVGLAEAGELKGRIAGATETSPAVVWIEGLESTAVPNRDTVLTHEEGGQLTPPVAIGFVGNSFILRNAEDRLHNMHLYLRLAYQKEASQRPLEFGATLFNVALPQADTEVRKPILAHHRYRDETGYIEVACNPHPEERAYLLVFDHQYATVTAKDGTFSIPDLPAGSREVRVWHAGAISKKVVEIDDGAPTLFE